MAKARTKEGARDILERHAAEAGWNDESRISLMCAFVEWLADDDGEVRADLNTFLHGRRRAERGV